MCIVNSRIFKCHITWYFDYPLLSTPPPYYKIVDISFAKMDPEKAKDKDRDHLE